MTTEVYVRTDPEDANGKPIHEKLSSYIERVVLEKTDPRLGHVEQVEENLGYLAGIVGRMLEVLIINRIITDPREIDALLFGGDTNHLKEIIVTGKEGT